MSLPLARRPRRGLPAEPGPLFAPIVLPAVSSPAPPSEPPSLLPLGQSLTPLGNPLPVRWTVWRDRIDVEAGLAWIHARYPSKPAEELSAAVGMPIETARKMLQRETLPSTRTFLVMMAVFGPDFVAALYDPAPPWLAGLARAWRLAQLEAQLAAEEADLARRRRQLAGLGLEALRAIPAGALR